MTTDTITPRPAIPPLENGDCLNRVEFERRYEAMQDDTKAELIDGIVYMQSAVRWQRHGEPHSDLMTWLGAYKAATPGVRSADNTSNRLDMDNEPQPDCMLFIDPQLGGQVQISDDDYIVGGAELVAEIASSSVSLDRGPKLSIYRRHGVREYLIWRVDDRVFEWYVLSNGSYELLKPDNNGWLCSNVFPGLWLDVDALLNGELARVHQTLQQGTVAEEHRQFVAELQQRQSK